MLLVIFDTRPLCFRTKPNCKNLLCNQIINSPNCLGYFLKYICVACKLQIQTFQNFAHYLKQNYSNQFTLTKLTNKKFQLVVINRKIQTLIPYSLIRNKQMIKKFHLIYQEIEEMNLYEQWPDFGCEGIKVQRAHQPTSQCQGKKNISLLLFSLATTGRKLEGELQYEVLKKLDQIIEQLSRQQLSHVFFGLGVLGHLTDERLKKLKKQIHKVLLTTTPEQTYYMVYGLAKSGNVDEQLLFNMRLRVGEFVGWKRATEKNALSMVRCLYRMGSTEDECRWTLRGVYPPQYKQAYLDGDLKDVRDFFHTREDKWYPHFPNYYGDNLHYPFRYAVNDIKQYQPDAKQPI
eukprot:TRINITY_DN7278_c0_g1_i2.p1 TRINITY_DN7278_c0_g1~~TRINITY_DN7278_c0_g1_i2.p1  ORF type:complete len:347 (+),score=22.54 TRINITY_DN7278_c0_g1_i2:144-1184(+)